MSVSHGREQAARYFNRAAVELNDKYIKNKGV